MPKRSSKKAPAKKPARKAKPQGPKDVNQLAYGILGALTGDAEPEAQENPAKDPAAVALGRRGGLKGGKARAKNMTPEERSEAAVRAAKARWARK